MSVRLTPTTASDPTEDVDKRGATWDVNYVSESEVEAISNPSGRPSPRSKWFAPTVGGLVILAVFADPDGLVDRVPILYAIVTGVLGFGCGLYAVVRLQPRLETQGWRGYVAVVALPLIAIFFASRLGRFAFETAAFAGFAASASTVEAPFVGMSSGKSGPHGDVKIDPTSREIRVSVTGDLYARLDAHRYPGRDCLTLTVQTGRFGVRRALIPAPLSKGLESERLHPCPAEVTAWAAIRSGS